MEGRAEGAQAAEEPMADTLARRSRVTRRVSSLAGVSSSGSARVEQLKWLSQMEVYVEHQCSCPASQEAKRATRHLLRHPDTASAAAQPPQRSKPRWQAASRSFSTDTESSSSSAPATAVSSLADVSAPRSAVLGRLARLQKADTCPSPCGAKDKPVGDLQGTAAIGTTRNTAASLRAKRHNARRQQLKMETAAWEHSETSLKVR